MNADHEEAVEFAKISKRENRVYVGNLSYDVKYRDLMEFMRGGGLGNFSLFCCVISGGVFWHLHLHLAIPKRGVELLCVLLRFLVLVAESTGLSDRLEFR